MTEREGEGEREREEGGVTKKVLRRLTAAVVTSRIDARDAAG